MAASETSCWRNQVQYCLVCSSRSLSLNIRRPLPFSPPQTLLNRPYTLWKCCCPSLPMKRANLPASPATPSRALTCTLTSRRVRPISVMTGSTLKGRLMLS